MTRRFRPRKELKTWLYADLPEQASLIEYVEYLRSTRQLAKTIRNGLRLMWSLGEGDLSVLFELFPGVKTQFEAPKLPPGDDGLRDEIRELKQLVMNQATIPAAPSHYPTLQPATASALPLGGTGNLKLGGGKSISIAMPDFSDDEDTIVMTRVEGVGDDWLNKMLSFADTPQIPKTIDERIKVREFTKHEAELIEDQKIEKRVVEPDDNPPATRKGKLGAKLAGLQPLSRAGT